MQQTFKAIIEKHPGMDAAFITIPFSVKEVFGSNGQVKVTVRLNGYTYRSSLAPLGDGNHVLGIRKEIRNAIGKTFGDEIEVVLELDVAPRTFLIPEDLAALLQENPAQNERFRKLAYTHQKEYVNWITEAKKPETRLRRLEKTMEMLLK